MSPHYFRQRMYTTLLDLATTDGINASGKEDVYGCIFGRDSAITILKILKACSRGSVQIEEEKNLLAISRRALITLCQLQGKETNVESGEEPGKFIHEYRKEKYERLLMLDKPWFIYPDGILRNYDSIDSTPLNLIAIYNYWQYTKDSEFLLSVLPHVEAGLNWIITYGDSDKDQLLEYELVKERLSGGLVVQSWTDSHESLMQHDNTFPLYPIAPVEVQGYAWLALQLWADFYMTNTLIARTEKFAQKLRLFAQGMKKRFNEAFLFEDNGYVFPAQALDGNKNLIKTVTGNPLLLLWGAYNNGSETTCILDDKYRDQLVNRAFLPDLFDDDAGIRTMSTLSKTYQSGCASYHNGSFWPKLNGMAHEGLENFGYITQAEKLKEATLKPLLHFGTPIELYIKEHTGYVPFSGNGQEACKEQAWSAAVAFDLLS